MPNKLKAVVIGAGNIGAFYDNPASKNILTHAHAYKKHPGFELVGFVDSDIKRAIKAANVWGGLSDVSVFGLSKKTKIDVVSICVPDREHNKILKHIEKLNISGGIIEKPLTADLGDSQKIVKSKFFKNHKFLVNYTRRFVPEFQKLKKRIAKKENGKFLTGSGIYGKGFLHNGSHMVDLLRYLLGEVKSKKIISTIYDFGKSDPTYSAMLELDNGGNFLINGTDSRLFSIFELDLFFQKARIRILDGGYKIEEYSLVGDEEFEGYKKFTLKKSKKTAMGKSLYCAVDNLQKAINKNEALICTVNEGYQTQKICTTKK